MIFTLEKELRPIVERRLFNQGYEIAHEVMLGFNWCDMVAARYTRRIGRRKPKLLRIMAIELKLNRIEEVLQQATRNAPHSHRSFAAMPANIVDSMREGTLQRFREAGVGLIAVGEDCIKLRVGAKDTGCPSKNKLLEDRIWRGVLRNKRRKAQEARQCVRP